MERRALAKAEWNDPIVQHMHREFSKLHTRQTVGEALDWLRQHPPPGRIIYFYVVDEDGCLQGVIPTRRLILSPHDQVVADLMVREVVTLPATATVFEACESFIQHRLLAFPVIDEKRQLLGVVDVELFTKELEQLGEGRVRDDIFQLVGVHEAAARHGSPVKSFRHRFPWLGCNLVAGILAAILSGVYREELERAVALAFFIPVVLNLAESVSSQSVILSLQLLHGRPLNWSTLPRRLSGELVTGFMLGVASGAIIALVALFWLGQGRVAVCLVGGISGGVSAAAVMGMALPFLLRFMHLEPRVAAGPVALAAADVVTILLYLNLARWLLA